MPGVHRSLHNSVSILIPALSHAAFAIGHCRPRRRSGCGRRYWWSAPQLPSRRACFAGQALAGYVRCILILKPFSHLAAVAVSPSVASLLTVHAASAQQMQLLTTSATCVSLEACGLQAYQLKHVALVLRSCILVFVAGLFKSGGRASLQNRGLGTWHSTVHPTNAVARAV